MAVSKWATYENVNPPQIDSNFFNNQPKLEDFYENPIYETFIQSVPQYQPEVKVISDSVETSEQTPEQDNKTKKIKKAKEIETERTQPREDYKKYKGFDQFMQAYNQALKVNPNISKYKDFLIRTAKRESGFNSYIQNSAGAPYYGYFQMGKDAIKLTSNLSVEQFRNDPVAQILAACKLYEYNLTTIKKIGVYDIGKQKGYSDDALVAGSWMGGPGGVKKYLLGKGDPSDSHWYKNKNAGSSVGKIMNNWIKGI